MKRNWFTVREGRIGHLSLKLHLCEDSDSSCHSRLELLSMKENCQITVTCVGRRQCCTNMQESDVAHGRRCCMNIGGQNGVNFSEKFTKFTKFTLCKLFGNFSINVVNFLTKMQTFLR